MNFATAKTWGKNTSSAPKPLEPGRIDANASSSFRAVASGINWQSSMSGFDNGVSTDLSKIDVADQYAAFAQYQPSYQSTHSAITRNSPTTSVSSTSTSSLTAQAPNLTTQLDWGPNIKVRIEVDQLREISSIPYL